MPRCPSTTWLRGFRSYAELEVDFPAGPQVVVGGNAAGKTNLHRGDGRAVPGRLAPDHAPTRS